jgi:hypothetical protein
LYISCQIISINDGENYRDSSGRIAAVFYLGVLGFILLFSVSLFFRCMRPVSGVQDVLSAQPEMSSSATLYQGIMELAYCRYTGLDLFYRRLFVIQLFLYAAIGLQ